MAQPNDHLINGFTKVNGTNPDLVIALTTVSNGVTGASRPEIEKVPDLDASKLVVNLTDTPKEVPQTEGIVFGNNFTDHMLVTSFDPSTGWSAPVIQPYQNLSLDPASSCIQYCTSLFEGMKAYLGPDGEPRLFRPEMNMRRMKQSAWRAALPDFDENELLKLIKKLVALEKRWIPSQPGYSLYIRPTMIGTRKSLGVTASTHAMIYVICCPTGPYFGPLSDSFSLYAVSDIIRAWPGGTGAFKLGVNYAPGFEPQRRAAEKGYKQCLWLLEEDGEHRITEAGAMNFFIALKSEDGDGVEVVTPPLDGTILPGVTRDSVIRLAKMHGPKSPVLPGIDSHAKISVLERPLTMSQLETWSREGRLMEAFTVGTAVIVASVDRIGYKDSNIVLPESKVFAKALLERIQSIQEGRYEWEGWSECC